MVSISNKLFDLVKEGQFQEALLLSEENYQSEEKNITSLIDYVKILIEFKLFEVSKKKSVFDILRKCSVINVTQPILLII